VSEIRLYVLTSEKESEQLMAVMTDAFEDDGYAIATMEIDEKRDLWEASLYLMADEEGALREQFSSLLAAQFPGKDILREVIEQTDWIAKSLEGLTPVAAGRFLVHGSHDRDKVRAGQISIEIDAGQAFGTGHHGTTVGCLEMIDRVMASRQVTNVLDLGTGTGVLAIAARKIKTVPVLATDIDPIATEVARQNARKNGLGATIAFETAPGFHSTSFSKHGPFDLIIANILAKPLMKMAPALSHHLKNGGCVILSGILASQRWKVLSAYNGQGLAHVRTIWRNGWVTILLENKSKAAH
jgi:ribosomal protein L11 methyltransferase